MYCELIALILGLVALGAAKVLVVEVGADNTFRYNPDSIKADVGDIVDFHFNAMHSVIAGDFNAACKPVTSEGFYSEEMPSGDKTFFSITVNDTNPIFFYCGVDGHCQGGMVGVINESPDKMLSAYRGAALGSDRVETPEGVFGGNQSSQAVSSSSSSSSESSPSSTSSGAGTESSMSTTTAPTTSAETSSPSSTTTTKASGSDAGHLTSPMEAIACLILAGIAAVFVL